MCVYTYIIIVMIMMINMMRGQGEVLPAQPGDRSGSSFQPCS